jgi:hypothetical protein
MDYQTLETIVDKLRNILDLPQKEIPAALDDFVHNQEMELAYMELAMQNEHQMSGMFENGAA